jgi:plasmid maintenance system antidote protein VapI
VKQKKLEAHFFYSTACKTASTALRLAKCLNTSAEYWLTLQMQYELAAVQKVIGERLEREIRPISLERQTDEED